MRIGEEFEVDIIDMSPNGEGVAKIKGFPIFIKNVRINDHIRISITNLISGCAEAEVVP
jgi:predicted RNA-binding protein with TRAM domain